jgi:GNAT superfamily N-acetyltransferase
VHVRRIQPDDEAGLAESADVLRASDKDMWPDLEGFSRRDIRAYAQFRGTSRRYDMLAAGDRGGPILGVVLMERSLVDNLHAVEVTVAVHPAHRRRGVGTALVAGMGEAAAADGREVLNSIVDVPLSVAAHHASRSFAPKVGFTPTLGGNTRHLRLPVDPARLDQLRGVVAGARDAADYRTVTFDAPWPEELMEDHGELLRRMSTDEPAGDSEREEEFWDERRLRESEELLAARGASKFVAVSQHAPSGRVVAMSEILVGADTPAQAWQAVTVVDRAHRGHRLGLAVKIANLDALAARAPAVRLIVTGNAAVNAPMIAVNDMMGFEVAGEGMFWQKRLGPARRAFQS